MYSSLTSHGSRKSIKAVRRQRNLGLIKGKQLWSSESWIFDEKKKNKYKNPITSNIHACTPSSITHLDVYTKTTCIYKLVVFCTIGEVFATGCFTFNYRQRYQEKITLFIPRATGSRSSSLYLSFWNTNYKYKFIDLRKRAVFKLKKSETGTGNLYFRTTDIAMIYYLIYCV